MNTTKEKRLSMGFAVFNNHVNDAGKRADAEFIAQFGQDRFDRHIKPCHEAGIMTVLNPKSGKVSPNKYRTAWIVLVTAYVNENREWLT